MSSRTLCRWVPFLALLGACQPPTEHFPGLQTGDYFPSDGDRRAEYLNDDTSLGWTLVVENIAPDATTFEWSRTDTGEILGSVTWAASKSDGITILGWTDGNGVPENFDAPVRLAEATVLTGDVVTTETDGRTFTSTYVGTEDCPVSWGMAWEECLHFTLDDGDGDAMAGPIFAGDYWLVEAYGAAWMRTTGYPEKWDLAHYQWSGE